MGSLNLAEFVDPATHVFDAQALEAATRVAVRALDNVIDLYEIPSDRVMKTARANRRIGLGVMGVASMLCRLRTPYDSDKGRAVCQTVACAIQRVAEETSRELALQKGVFPNYELSAISCINEMRRNAALTTVAPTGTISNVLGTSGGIEPHFALAYFRKFQGQTLQYLDADLLRELVACGALPADERARSDSELLELLTLRGSLRRVAAERPDLCAKVPPEVVAAYCTAGDISAEDHVLMQARWQDEVDNSISKVASHYFSSSALFSPPSRP